MLETASNPTQIEDYLGVFVLDLDNLEQTNDLKGHSAGDDALATSAKVLLEVFDKHVESSKTNATQTVVARTGDDEFSVMTASCDDQRAAVLSERIMSSLGDEGISICVVYSCSRSRSKIMKLIEIADEAMYLSKRSGVLRTVK